MVVANPIIQTGVPQAILQGNRLLFQQQLAEEQRRLQEIEQARRQAEYEATAKWFLNEYINLNPLRYETVYGNEPPGGIGPVDQYTRIKPEDEQRLKLFAGLPVDVQHDVVGNLRRRQQELEDARLKEQIAQDEKRRKIAAVHRFALRNGIPLDNPYIQAMLNEIDGGIDSENILGALGVGDGSGGMAIPPEQIRAALIETGVPPGEADIYALNYAVTGNLPPSAIASARRSYTPEITSIDRQIDVLKAKLANQKAKLENLRLSRELHHNYEAYRSQSPIVNAEIERLTYEIEQLESIKAELVSEHHARLYGGSGNFQNALGILYGRAPQPTVGPTAEQHPETPPAAMTEKPNPARADRLEERGPGMGEQPEQATVQDGPEAGVLRRDPPVGPPAAAPYGGTHPAYEALQQNMGPAAAPQAGLPSSIPGMTPQAPSQAVPNAFIEQKLNDPSRPRMTVTLEGKDVAIPVPEDLTEAAYIARKMLGLPPTGMLSAEDRERVAELLVKITEALKNDGE